MSLFKRGSVYWAIWTANGIRHQKSTGTSSRKQAERIEQQFRDEVNALAHGLIDPHPEMTVAALAARFLADGNPKAHHKDRLKHLLPFFGNVELGQLGRGLINTYRQVRQQQDTITAATTNRDVSVLRRVCNWAVEQNLLVVSPLTRIGMERERRTKRSVLTVSDEDKLLAAAAPHLRELITAALDTGMRRGELLSQQWDDVDLPRGLLSVTHSKTHEGTFREIPLSKRLCELLAARAEKTGMVFTFGGQRLKCVKHAWSNTIKRAGIRYLRFHDLRHTFNTRLLEAGVMQEVRMAIMGHSSGSRINAIYTHIELPAKRAAIGKLEAWMVGQRSLQDQSERKEESSATSQNADANRAAS